jgi:type IV secretory pathway VirB2 component (pilin)
MKHNLKILVIALLFILVAFSSDNAFSSSNRKISQIGDTLCKIWKNCLVKGNLLTIIGTVAVFSLGIGAMLGKVNWGLVFMVCLGLVIITGALRISMNITGNSNTSQNCNNTGGGLVSVYC